jgi:hypothetical protein
MPQARSMTGLVKLHFRIELSDEGVKLGETASSGGD